MSIKEIFTTMEYSPAPENEQVAINWLDNLDHKFKHYHWGSVCLS